MVVILGSIPRALQEISFSYCCLFGAIWFPGCADSFLQQMLNSKKWTTIYTFKILFIDKQQTIWKSIF